MGDWCESVLCSTLCELVFYAVLVIMAYFVLDWLLRRPMLDTLTDRYVLITGCDSGFGMLLARRLDGQGCPVFAACLTDEGMVRLQQCCSSRLVPLKLDVCDPQAILDAVTLVTAQLPPGKGLWGVVNNAGIMPLFGPAAWHSRQDYSRVLEVNTLGMIQVTLEFLPLVQKERGRLLLTASILGRFAAPCSSSYVVSKFATVGFTHSLRRELRTFGVDVISIQPGGHRTNLVEPERVRGEARKLWDRQPELIKLEYGEKYLHNMVENGLKALELTCSRDLSGVVDAYYHALFARYPRAVYLVGLDAYMYLFLSYLPICVTDLMVYILGLRPACAR